MPPHLHIYREPESAIGTLEGLPEPAVGIPLRDLLPLMAMAQRRNYLWLKDFLDDEVRITEDLHEVLLNFRPQRPTAS